VPAGAEKRVPVSAFVSAARARTFPGDKFMNRHRGKPGCACAWVTRAASWLVICEARQHGEPGSKGRLW